MSDYRAIVEVIHDYWLLYYLCVANTAIDEVERGVDKSHSAKQNPIDLTLTRCREPEEDEGPLATQENGECTGPGQGRSKRRMLVDEIREEVDLI